MIAMNRTVLRRVRAAAAKSELLHAVASVRHDGGLRLALGGATIRRLSATEISRLEQLGNEADAWSNVWVADGFDPERVRRCCLHGVVVLGRFAGLVCVAEDVALPAGVYNSNLADSVVGHDACVRDVRLLAKYVLGAGAVVFDCGTIACAGKTAFGNGQYLRLGPETGGREVPAFAELDVETAAACTRQRRRSALFARYAATVARYKARATGARGVIERGARLRAVPDLRNTYVGPHAVIEGASTVTESTLLSNAEEPTRVESGCCVRSSLLQWGSHVSTLAVVEHSVLAEHSTVERQAKVTQSFLGPNTSVGAGEVACCLLGPFVSCHHQSLLIATLWPQGRGNVAYGANVGSNHTSRAPDQECWVGEGVFFGLGVNVQFPTNLSEAPYTVVASGLTLLPQRVTFPFSMLAAPVSRPASISPAFNEIFPAWVLADNWFALERTQLKLRARNMARRTRIDPEILRPEIVDQMRDACLRLEEVQNDHNVQEIYTERQIPGLGKNFLRESSRQAAVEAYRFAISLYALLGLKDRVADLLSNNALGFHQILALPADQPRWEHQRRLLLEDLGITHILPGLQQLAGLLKTVANKVTTSRARDEERGRRVIPDYAVAHPPFEMDEVVMRTQNRVRRCQAELATLLEALEAGGPDTIPSSGRVEPAGNSILCRPA
jgi:hypothetical protein